MTRQEQKAYISLYKKNTLSYSLVLVATAAELFYVVTVLDAMAVSYLMGVTVLVNIVLLFSLFTCAMKVHVYHQFWNIAGILLGAYMLVRMVVLVPIVIRPYAWQTQLAAANLLGGVLLMTAGLISMKRTTVRRHLQNQLEQQKPV